MIRIFDLELVDLSLREVVDKALILNGFSFVVTPNLQHFVELNNNYSDLLCYRKAAITLCDSRVVGLISKLIGKPIHNVIPGSDLTRYLFDDVLEANSFIMVVGSSTDEISFLRAKYNLTNLKHYSPPMGFINDEEEVQNTIDMIHEVKPRYLFLAVGFPRQERLACKLKEGADYDCLALCIGASIDFITGKQKRAPLIWQKLHIEWLYRFLQEPKRLFKRYFFDSWGIFPLLLKEIRKKDD